MCRHQLCNYVTVGTAPINIYSRCQKTFQKSFAVLPFNGIRMVKRQNRNGKRPLAVCPFPTRERLSTCATPTVIELRYNIMEVAKCILTHSKAWERPTASKVHKKSRCSRPQSSLRQLLSVRIASC